MQRRSILLLCVLVLISFLNADVIQVAPRQTVSGMASRDEFTFLTIEPQTDQDITGIDIVIEGCDGRLNVYMNKCTASQNETECKPSETNYQAAVTMTPGIKFQPTINSLQMCQALSCAPNAYYYYAIQSGEVQAVNFTVTYNTFTVRSPPSKYDKLDSLKINKETSVLNWEVTALCSSIDEQKKCKGVDPVGFQTYAVYAIPESTPTTNLGTDCGVKGATLLAKDLIFNTYNLKDHLAANTGYLITVVMTSSDGWFTTVYEPIFYYNEKTSPSGGRLLGSTLAIALIILGVWCVCCAIAVIALVTTGIVVAVVVKKLSAKKKSENLKTELLEAESKL